MVKWLTIYEGVKLSANFSWVDFAFWNYEHLCFTAIFTVLYCLVCCKVWYPLSKITPHLKNILIKFNFMKKCSFSSVQLLSHVRLCDPMNRSTPGLPVHHQLPEFTQTQSIELVMPSSPLILCRPLLLLPPIPPSIRVFSNESTLCMCGQSTGVSALASFLLKKSQGWSPLEWTGWISLQSKGLSRVFSNTTVQKHQFFGTHSLTHSLFLHSPTLTSIPLEKL